MAAKVLGLFYGVFAIGLAFLCDPLGGILRALNSLIGALFGPLLALFLLGVMTKRGNRVGAIAGTVAGAVVISWIFIGSNVHR